MNGILQKFGHWPVPALVAANAVLVAVVGVLDYLVALDVPVTLFYLLPIALGTWHAGRRAGLFLAGLCLVAWLMADVFSQPMGGRSFVWIWNTITLASVFGLVAALLGALKDQQDHLEQTVVERTRSLRDEIAERVRTEVELTKTNAALTAAREDLRRSFAELQQAHETLQRTQYQLIESAKMESVGRMAAGVAHEVKNPLMTLSLGADYFLGRTPANPDEEILLQDMKEAIRRASNIINILLDYARPQPLQRTREDINRLIENSLTLVRHQLIKARVEVVRELCPDPPPLMLDRTRIEHIFVNLFMNALQAMPEGGTLTVRSTVAPAPVGGGGPGAVIVEVEDTGCGISTDALTNIFEPFFTTKPPGHGTGLGLAIVRKIMDIHGATIRLANRAQGGVLATLQFNTEPNEPS